MNGDAQPTPPGAVTLVWRGQTYHLAAEQTLGQALAILGVPPELALAVCRGQAISAETALLPGDIVRLVMVMPGG